MQIEPVLENTKIRLRAIEPEDLERLYQWENNPAFWYGGDTRTPYSRFILKKFIQGAGTDIYESRQTRFMIESKENGETVGIIDLFDFDVFNSRIGTGIMIDTPFQQKGYASQALKLIIQYVFDHLQINQLYAHVSETNTISRKLFEGQGFQHNGTLKNWLRQSDRYIDILVYQLFKPSL